MANYIVAVDGTANGVGSLEDPVSFEAIVANGNTSSITIQPGDELHLRGGTYYTLNNTCWISYQYILV